MKVMLVSCPTWATWAPSYALGLLTSALKQNGHQAITIDLNIEIYHSVNKDDQKLWLDQYGGYWDNTVKVQGFFDRYRDLLESVAKRLATAGVSVVGFSVNSASRLLSQHLNRLMKKYNPQIITIFGGPDCFRAYYGLSFMDDPNIDAICTLEGDIVLPEFIDTIEKGDFGKYALKGFVIRNRQTRNLLDGQDPVPVMDLDKLPFPDYSWADLQQYTIKNRLTMMLSRGCINRCSFCSEGANFKKYRFRSAINIISEIKQHMQMLGNPSGVFINFNDSLINGNMKEFVELCDLIKQEGLKFSWGGMALFRPEMTMEVITKMKQAGCVELMWGLEAGNDPVLKLMRKHFNVALAERIIGDCFKVGIKQCTNIIIGFPGETDSDFRETAAFVTKNNRYFEAIGLPYMTLHKNSHVYENASLYNIKNRDAALEWELMDGSNTYPIRQVRRQHLMSIIENKLFDQGKYEGTKFSIVPYSNKKSIVKLTKFLYYPILKMIKK
ncbi:radical SAM protein [bacterium]|nr:radical SAM protein [candidate division CSSED10-310 bacterium]